MPSDQEAMFTLDAEELDTILAIGRNDQSGRVTNYELKELVRVYRQAQAASATPQGEPVDDWVMVPREPNLGMFRALTSWAEGTEEGRL